MSDGWSLPSKRRARKRPAFSGGIPSGASSLARSGLTVQPDVVPVLDRCVALTDLVQKLPQGDDLIVALITEDAEDRCARLRDRILALQHRLLEVLGSPASDRGNSTLNPAGGLDCGASTDEINTWPAYSRNFHTSITPAVRMAFDAVEQLYDGLEALQHQDIRILMSCDTPYGMFQIHASPHVPRPQLSWRDLIDNRRSAVFRPHLTCKPNALTPLPDYTVPDTTFDTNLAPLTDYPHPYATEIAHIAYSPDILVPKGDPVPFERDLDPAKLTWVSTPPQLAALGQRLCGVDLFAIDLEHHSEYSFRGITALIQISTRTHDYIVDVFPLWRDLNAALLPAFSNPSIRKVIHGSSCDMMWLQRDFSLYVVHLFDTALAAGLLGYKQRGLAFLLSSICHVTTDKSHQRSDWRVRPLTSEQLQYARMDTHYLLYIHDVLVRRLARYDAGEGPTRPLPFSSSFQKVYQASPKTAPPGSLPAPAPGGTRERPSLMLLALRSSNSRALLTYQYKPFRPARYQVVIDRFRGGSLSPFARTVLYVLFDARDLLARSTDQGPGVVINNYTLAWLASSAPRAATKVSQTLSPAWRRRFPLITEHAKQITDCIVAAGKHYHKAQRDGHNPIKTIPRPSIAAMHFGQLPRGFPAL